MYLTLTVPGKTGTHAFDCTLSRMTMLKEVGSTKNAHTHRVLGGGLQLTTIGLLTQ